MLPPAEAVSAGRREATVLTGSCYCGALKWTVTGELGSVTACNCTICRRYVALWLYGWEGETIAASGPEAAYARGPVIDYCRCETCGCVAFYRVRTLEPDGRRKMAVNARLADDPDAVAHLEIDHFDGLDSFDDLPRDHRRVADMWF
jgi:hypothetical protein